MTSQVELGEAPPFSTPTVLWIIGVGAVFGLLFLILTAYAPDKHGLNGGVHALSNSAVGYAGAVELLQAEGAPVATSRTPHPEREHPYGLLVLTPGVGAAKKPLTAFRVDGPELVVLPKWNAFPAPGHAGWVMGAGPAPLPEIDAVLNAFDLTDHISRAPGRSAPVLRTTRLFSPAGTPVPVGQITGLQTISGPDRGWINVVVDPHGGALLAKKTDGDVYILSDPDLLNNQGLAQLANAQGASAIIDALRDHHRPVVFDLTLAGFNRTRNLSRLAFEPPFLGVTLCALAAAVLMGLHGAARFGAPARQGRAFDFGKRALADNSAALVRLVRREHRMGRGYAALTRTLAARTFGLPRTLDDHETDGLLDRLGRTRGVSAAFTDLERAARETKDVPGLMTAVRELYRWRLEITHERD